MNIYEWIDRLEENLVNIDQTRRRLFLLLATFVFGYGFYVLFLQPAYEEIVQTREQIDRLKKEIQKNNHKKYESKIAHLKSEILHLKSMKERYQQDLYALKFKIEQKKNIFYNKKNFSKFLDHLLADSVKYNILLHSIEIGDIHQSYIGLLEKRKNVEVKGTGNFLNIVKFIRNVEEEKVLLKVEKLQIETNGTLPHFFFNIKLFGMTQ